MSKDRSRSKGTSQGVIAVVLTSDDVVWEMKEMTGDTFHSRSDRQDLLTKWGKGKQRNF